MSDINQYLYEHNQLHNRGATEVYGRDLRIGDVVVVLHYDERGTVEHISGGDVVYLHGKYGDDNPDTGSILISPYEDMIAPDEKCYLITRKDFRGHDYTLNDHLKPVDKMSSLEVDKEIGDINERVRKEGVLPTSTARRLQLLKKVSFEFENLPV